MSTFLQARRKGLLLSFSPKGNELFIHPRRVDKSEARRRFKVVACRALWSLIVLNQTALKFLGNASSESFTKPGKPGPYVTANDHSIETNQSGPRRLFEAWTGTRTTPRIPVELRRTQIRPVRQRHGWCVGQNTGCLLYTSDAADE